MCTPRLWQNLRIQALHALHQTLLPSQPGTCECTTGSLPLMLICVCRQTTPAIRSVVDTVISTPADREADYATRRTSKPAASRSRAATPAGGEASSTQQQAEQQQVSLTEGDGDDSSSKDNSTDTPKNASTSSSSSSQAEESGTQDLPAEEFEGTGPAATKHVQGAAVRHIRFVRCVSWWRIGITAALLG